MCIQPAREFFTLNVIQEMFRDGLPNEGSLVKVNFELKEIKIADEYAKVLSVVCSGKNFWAASVQ